MARVKIMSAKEAVKLIKDGDTVALGNFLGAGTALDLSDALTKQKTKDLTLIINGVGFEKIGLGPLITNDRVKKMFMSYAGNNMAAGKMVKEGRVEFVPQGTFIEKIRCAGAGIPAFFTPTGVGTKFAEGRKVHTIGGKKCIMEEAFPKPDFAIVKAWKADKKGNLVFRGMAHNLNSVMAMAAKTTIVEVEEIVEIGEIKPNEVMTPSIFVDILVQTSSKNVAPWQFRKAKTNQVDEGRERIAKRVAQELRDGDVVNLGIGMPLSVPKYLSSGVTVDIQSECGILGVGSTPSVGEEDVDVCDAGGNPVTVKPGGCFFNSVMSFDMIRGGHIDITVLGAFQADAKGNLANSMIPGGRVPGPGGGMDLAAGANVIAAMKHTTPNGKPKILEKCTFPLTAVGTVKLIVTELAVMKPTGKGLVLEEILDSSKTVKEIQALTGAKLIVSKNLIIHKK